MNKKNKGSFHPAVSKSIIATKTEFHSGPLPSPLQLEHYENILPGLADRIVGMAEKQSDHRQILEKEL